MEGIIEVDGVKYYKPNMCNLRGRWGREILESIRNQPKPDWERLEREAAEMEVRLLAEHVALGEMTLEELEAKGEIERLKSKGASVEALYLEGAR